MTKITNFVWNPVDDCIVSELDGTGSVQAVYTNEPQQYGGVISQRRGTTTSTYHADALGTTRVLTDSTQTATDTYLHDAWGNPITSSGSTVNPFRWVGRYGYYHDASTGLIYVRARLYQPTVARWCSVDPLGFIDGTHKYLYVQNASLTFPDPSGASTFWGMDESEIENMKVKDHFSCAGDACIGIFLAVTRVTTQVNNLYSCAVKNGCLSRLVGDYMFPGVECRHCTGEDKGYLAFYSYGFWPSRIVFCQNEIWELEIGEAIRVFYEEFYHAITICNGGKRHPTLVALDALAVTLIKPMYKTCAICVAQEVLAKKCAGVCATIDGCMHDARNSCSEECPVSMEAADELGLQNGLRAWSTSPASDAACAAINASCGIAPGTGAAPWIK